MTIRITYDGKTIDLLIGPDGLDQQYLIEHEQGRSGSGMVETINHYAIVEGLLDYYAGVDAYNDLVGWWSWANQGMPFSLAMDTSAAASTTLDGAANAAQKVVPLTDTTGFAANGVCLIRSADRFTFEIVEIDSVSAGVSVTAKENLKYPYAAGATFRHADYFPNAVCLDEKFNPRKHGVYYRNTLHFVEEVDTMPTARRVGTGSWGTPATVTIADGILALPGPGYYLVATQSGAATDDLDQITGLSNGDEVLLGPADGTKDVVVKHGTYIKLNAETDFVLDGAYDMIRLLCIGSDTCKELGSASND